MFDLIVAGGGLAGIASAISASRSGLKTLIIERLSFLGGAATAGLVTPMMKNMLSSGESLNSDIYHEILERMKLSGDSGTHENLNPGWFNPEILKIILDEMCLESGVNLLFDSFISDASINNKEIKNIEVINKSGKNYYYSKYFIDATGDADLAVLAGCKYNSGNKNGINQAVSLRFMMSGVDLKIFSEWIEQIDPDKNVSPVCRDENNNILITTAYTSEDKGWNLAPIFKQGIEKGIIKQEDAEYFQIFSVPGQNGTIAFNCPRIYSEKPLDPTNAEDISYAYITGRKQIKRISEFCKKFFKGFENAFISEIAGSLGIRESRRIIGKYTLTENDIATAKKFPNSVAKSNYPVDIHSQEKNKSILQILPENDYYEIPLDSLIPENINNLIVVGRSISSTFKAQASLRIQPNCISMGEYAGKYAADILKEKAYE